MPSQCFSGLSAAFSMDRLLRCIPCTNPTTGSARWRNGTDRRFRNSETGIQRPVQSAYAWSVGLQNGTTVEIGTKGRPPRAAYSPPGQVVKQSTSETAKEPPLRIADVGKDSIRVDLMVHRRRDDATWDRYSTSTSQVIIQAAAAGEKGAFIYVTDDSTKCLQRVWINFCTMREESLTDTNLAREIRIEAVLVTSPMAAPKTKRQLLIEAFDHLRSEEFLNDALKTKMLPMKLQKIRCNPYLESNSGSYKKFLTAAENLGIFGSLSGLKLEPGDPLYSSRRWTFNLLSDADAKCPAVELVFHGTAVENIDSILKNGMNPRLRKYGAEYFGRKAETSKAYCKQDKSPWRMVVFLVLKVTDAHSIAFGGDAIVIKKVEYELPIAEVTGSQ